MEQLTYYYSGSRMARSIKIIEAIIQKNGYKFADYYNEFLIDIYLLLDEPESKHIAIDWDNTISSDQDFYKEIIQAYMDGGYKPFICTLRAPDKDNIDELRGFLENVDVDIYLTNGKPKRKYMKKKGVKVHLWIDDFYPGIAPSDSKIFKRNKIDY